MKCIRKIYGATVGDAENLDLVMSMYNLLECSSNYCDMTGNLWSYSKDEASSVNNDIVNTNSFKSFTYIAKLLRNTEADGVNEILRNATTVVSSKYLSKFWRSLDMGLINCKFKWMNHCVLSANCADNDNANSNSIIFTIKDTKLYVLVVILSAKNNKKLSKTSSHRV